MRSAYSVAGDGPALFLIHGIEARRSGCDGLAAGLCDRFTCISYDLRGHGLSPVPDRRFGLEDMVDDLEELRARQGVSQAHFAGHSLGGMIGPPYGWRYPDRVLSPAAFRTEDDSAKMRGVVSAMRERGIGPVLDTLTARWFPDGFCAAHPEVIERRKRQVMKTEPAVFLNVFDIYAETQMAPWLAEVRAPAQVLTGELDGGCNPRLNRLIHAALPG